MIHEPLKYVEGFMLCDVKTINQAHPILSVFLY
jgi:hypothetical protein